MIATGWIDTRRTFRAAGLALVLLPAAAPATAAESPELRARAEDALRRAVAFFRQKVAVEGGYVWRYGADLTQREGEGEASATTAWVQPPGTPSVGMAYLEAHAATGRREYLEGATDTAKALVKGQLRSGGWDYRIEFGPDQRRRYAYRSEPETPGRLNVSTLDDDTTQAALRLLVRTDVALGFADAAIHEAARYGLDALLRAQYPNGSWPQRFEGPVDPTRFEVKRASYPESWPRSHPGLDYRSFHTLNDNVLPDVVDVLLEAARAYGEARYRAAAMKVGEFLLLAQMPDPQPAWAQQYDFAMHPSWARRFEPPAVTGGESQGALRLLLRFFRESGDDRYLAAAARALDYLRRSLLPDGRLARFYELRSNRPLYFTRSYELTFDDADLPTHYAFKVPSQLVALAEELRQARSARGSKAPERMDSSALDERARAVQAVIAALDERGAWVTEGHLRTRPEAGGRVIESQAFVENVRALCRYLAATPRR